MKKKEINLNMIKYFVFMAGIFCFLTSEVFAISAPAIVHYINETNANRTPTYTWTNTHAGAMGYNVLGYNNQANSTILTQMTTAGLFIVHHHGNQGYQVVGPDQRIVQKNGNGTTYKNVNTVASNGFNKMRMAIYYGCKTGDTTTTYGDLAQETVNKGAGAAVAWKINTPVLGVNEWNRLFLEMTKANTIVEGFRHADYWMYQIRGTTEADAMKYNRTERGNIYGFINW